MKIKPAEAASITLAMKKPLLFSILLFSPLFFFGQQLSGLWIGSVSNDSTTVRKDESFEIALSEYKGKVYGYSRNTFMVNDTLYYIVKRVKGVIDGDICELKDDHVVSHNFPGKPEKGVKVTSTFRRNEADSTWYLEGDWKTNKTKKYYAVSGKVDLKEEKDYSLSKLFPHLEELQLDKEMPFYTAAKQKEVPLLTRTVIKPQSQTGFENNVAARKPATAIKTNTIEVDKEVLYLEEKKQNDIKTEQQQGLAANTISKPATGVRSNTIAVDKEILYLEEKKASDLKTEQQQGLASNTISKPATGVKPNTVAVDSKIVYAEEKTGSAIKTEKQASSSIAATNKPQTAVKTNTVAVDKEVLYLEEKKQNDTKTEQQQALAASKTDLPAPKFENNTKAGFIGALNKPVENPGNAAAFVEQRALASSQTVGFASDSLVLILYDNGEVDGDTVSVLMNGEVIIAKQMLRTTAEKKTIYTNGLNEITLILYAENLGKYPPNTGLLVIYDGDERYQVRFSADLNKNAAIVLRRK